MSSHLMEERSPRHRKGPRPTPPGIRFWKHVQQTEGCWLWNGRRNHSGYGSFSSWNRQPIAAHRFSYELANGPIPDGLWVLHVCDNPPCVNPAHLFLGTVADNNADMVAKGRHVGVSLPKTHCKRGHELIGDNVTMVRHSPPRDKYLYKKCVTCSRMHYRIADAKRRTPRRRRIVT